MRYQEAYIEIVGNVYVLMFIIVSDVEWYVLLFSASGYHR